MEGGKRKTVLVLSREFNDHYVGEKTCWEFMVFNKRGIRNLFFMNNLSMGNKYIYQLNSSVFMCVPST